MEKEKTIHKVERAFISARHRDYGVTIYHDLDTCEFPADYHFDNFANNALSALGCCDKSYFIRKIYIYGDLRKYTGLKPGSLNPGNTGAEIIVKHFPKRETVCRKDVCQNAGPQKEPKKPLATSALKGEIFSQSEIEEPPYTVMLATSDQDFVNTIKRLDKDNVAVLLACEYDAGEELKSAVRIKWWWPSFIEGKEYMWTPV